MTTGRVELLGDGPRRCRYQAAIRLELRSELLLLAGWEQWADEPGEIPRRVV